ncbi:MAG: hypothetical protein JSW45_03730 [Thiotrichales bacterium]|nr:MAG: hypothetical protein JSW45_03730 [Thiotrichales bacterium]
MRFKLPLIIAVSMAVLGCDPGLPEGGNDFAAGGSAVALSQGEFNTLAPEQQYMVANKLLGTMFRGVSVEDFFDMNAGIANPQPKSSNFLADTKTALQTKLSPAEILAHDTIIDGLDDEGNPDPTVAKYRFDDDPDARQNERPKQLPLARIKEYPVSRDVFVHWMAYVLMNTIMFSPAEEMESTDYTDVQNMFRFLVTNLESNTPIRQVIRSNLSTLARWRVSRSPENHALEAYELYLGLFETEEDSYRGGIACKDLYLTNEDDGYLIRRTDFPNTVPQLVLQTNYVTTCDDLYEVIAGHPLLIPRVVEVIYNYFVELRGDNLDYRRNYINSIANSNPETFEDIFMAILFSREYLLNVERPRSVEENLMPMLDTLQWHPDEGAGEVDEQIFRRMTEFSNQQIYMDGMGWATAKYKIGRLPDVPLDGLSFANYHKSMREELLMNRGYYDPSATRGIANFLYDENGDVKPFIDSMSLNDFVDYLFMSVLQRKADANEKADLIDVFATGVTGNHLTTDPDDNTITIVRVGRHDEIAQITFDYIARLPEFYYFRSVN